MTIDEYNKLTKKKSKYGNIKTTFNGEVYDSKKEAEYARQLQRLKSAHDLKERVVMVERQVPFKIWVRGGYNVGTYFADFRVTYGDGRVEIVDVKGINEEGKAITANPVYKFKKKCVEAIYRIKIIEA